MLRFADATDNAIPVHLISESDVEEFLNSCTEPAKTWLSTLGFKGRKGQLAVVPSDNGSIDWVAAGLGGDKQRAQGRFLTADAIRHLPKGTYQIESNHSVEDMEEHALAWLLSQYSFSRYRDQASHKADLVCPDGLDKIRLEAIAAGEVLTRDLINTPASDMGPEDLQRAAEALAQTHGAKVSTISGAELLEQNFPMIHAVGRASAVSPRLIDLSWGAKGPALVLVGKGVCFDTGGLNIKPAASMGLMKKDMGGAATVLGLAHMIMATNMPVRLRVLIPAVENAIDGSAFRPQDILTSRKGLTVEINNTDAEGRLVLADALAFADETPPDLMICMATLTGAARVAVGPDLAPFYTDDDTFSDALSESARKTRDPVWRMPFHTPYEAMIEPGIADLDNAPKGGFAGSITAALFLRRFVENTKRFAHFDVYGWSPSAHPGRSKGGVGQGARAIFDALPEVLDL